MSSHARVSKCRARRDMCCSALQGVKLCCGVLQCDGKSAS